MNWLSNLLRRPSDDAQGDAIAEPVSGSASEGSDRAVTGDNPIQRSEDDALCRASGARSFAQNVLALDPRSGFVVGVLGAWGSGKTSFINLARAEFNRAGVPILDFNPWMFSGAEQLVESFFVELAAQLRIRPGLAEVGKHLEEYGETFSGAVWLPVVGPWVERGRSATMGLGKFLQRRKEGVGGRRAKLEKALGALDRPLVVVLDDIDRLTTSEIRDVFRLVRLTASFPNVIYVVAFDRARVEQALAEQGIPGRDYLEKILQVAVDLPEVPSEVLNRQIFLAVDAALAGIDKPGPFDKEVWPDVFMEVIRPLIRNMRDVRRYSAAIHVTVRGLEGQIALADVLALEAVRVFLPNVFGRLHGAVDGLTTSSPASYGDGRDPPHLKAQIDGLTEVAGPHAEIVRAMINRLFPAGQRHLGGSYFGADWEGRWRRERRVAHEDFLRLYLEGVAGESLRAFTDAEQAWALIADRDAFDGLLRSLAPERLEDVISSLEAFEDRFAAEHVVPGTIVLLNLLADLPERELGMLELAPRLVVTRITYRLLRSLKDPNAVEEAVRRILPELRSLSAKLELIRQVGHRDDVGHRIISREAAAEFEKAWREEVRAASVNDLIKEQDLGRVLMLTKREADPLEAPIQIDDSPQLTLALLRAAYSEARGQSAGSRAIRRFPRLAWDALVELVSGEEILRARLEILRAERPAGADDLLALADKYLGGWRHNAFGDE